MDGPHFDALTRSLTAAQSRRGALRALLGGPLGLLGGATVLAKRGNGGGNRKKDCPPCKKKKDGKCKANKPDGTVCENGGTCQSGSCLSGSGSGGSGSGGSSSPSVCPSGNTGRACGADGTGRCRGGICYPPPTCRSTGEDCDPNNAGQCCGNVCTVFGAVAKCQPGPAGSLCRIDADCTSAQCVAYQCQ